MLDRTLTANGSLQKGNGILSLFYLACATAGYPPNLSLTPCKPYVDAVSHDDLVEAEFCPAHAVANWHHHAILAARHAVYQLARLLHPARWSGATRNWSSAGAVTLNPERDSVVKLHLAQNDIQPLAA